MPVALDKHRFSVDAYYDMARTGILRQDDRVELIDGEIVDMPPIGPEHAGSVRDLDELFASRFNDVAQVSVQSPIRLDPYNEPQPDLALLRRRPDSYRSGHPRPGDVVLLIEVADSTLATDRAVKMPLYAGFGIAETWIVDLRHDVVLIHREPSPGGYRVTRTAQRGEQVAPIAFPDREIAVDDLLG